MARKTRKHTKGKKASGIASIPELRRSFEHMEDFVDRKMKAKEPKEKCIKDLRKEWYHVFGKELNKASAEAFIQGRSAPSRRRTIRGGAALAGAPLDYITRPGMYLAPESIPNANGSLPLSGGAPSTFGSFVQYVQKGFFNPEIAQQYDPIKGQAAWPSPAPGMGSNAFMKGGKRRTRRGGAAGALLSQAFTRPFMSQAPPGTMQDMQDMWHGKTVGLSPDQVQRSPSYQLGSLYPKPVHIM